MEMPAQRSPRCPSDRRGYGSPAPNPFGHGIVFDLFPLEEMPEEVLPNTLLSRGKGLPTRDRMGSNTIWKPVWIGQGPFPGHGPLTKGASAPIHPLAVLPLVSGRSFSFSKIEPSK